MLRCRKQIVFSQLNKERRNEMRKVMVAGLPGKMIYLAAAYVARDKDMALTPFALSEEKGASLIEGINISHVPLSAHQEKITEISPDIIVDFTLPASVNRNAELYCQCQVPFVMGTTGGDRDLLEKTIKDSNISAVIAPNMAKQIVAFQAMMEFAAKNFPDVFKGYRLVISESHQKGKADTSGTAKAMVRYFNALGIPFKKKQIIMERGPQVQEVKLGVPAQYLSGHGWHTYTLLSEDGTVFFQFTHNVNGRDVYAQGTLDAIRFLSKRSEKGKVFSMIDVLKAA